jgi:ABC-type iron transport system FetAB ATPase subunit
VSAEALDELIDRFGRRRDAARVIWIAHQPDKLADGASVSAPH